MPPPSLPAKRLLPSKEASLFKELLTLYETRQLKKGQKTADQILKKFPEHGETLCMKGLLLSHLGKRDEGLELVKKGVRLDLTSHICWHVFGLIQKGEKNYEEALKSYTQALRFDKENMNILRDAAHLQTQLRIYDALVETRHTIVKLRPTMRQNWIALAVAYHLNGNLSDAKKVLEQYETTLKNIPDYDVEHSETLLYHVRVLEDLGELSDALSLLDISAKSRAIVDRTAIMEIRARLLQRLGTHDEAEHAWRALIEQNPDCYDYYRGFLSNKQVDLDDLRDETAPTALSALRDFSAQIPRATAPQRLALTVATGETFKEIVKPYLTSRLVKGVPSLFVDIKALYRDPEKQQIIEQTVDDLRASLAAEASSSSSEPTTYLWTLYFLAQHHSHLSRPERALELLAAAIAHTPTLPELHTCKARVLKRAGDLVGAVRCLEEARLLDGQDRFLNTKAAKYRLRAGFVEEANEILGLFTKKDAASPGADLEDMQSLLYLIEEGGAHYRSGRLNLALKRYLAVCKIFDEIEDDQFDFHGYSMRKSTINIYMSLIAWEDRLRSHPDYIAAALSASRIYVAVHDKPALATPSSSAAILTDAEKKAKKKAKKAAQKTQTDPKKPGANANATNEDKGLEPTPAKDDDPDGWKLLAVADPLERAAKLLSPLHTLARGDMDVWVATYDVAVRRKKYLQAAKALNTARALDASHPELHLRTIEFHQTLSALPPFPSPTATLLAGHILPLAPDTLNTQYVQQHGHAPLAHLAGARAARVLGAPRGEVEAGVFAALGGDVRIDVRSARALLAFLETLPSPRADEFRAACAARFPLATVFGASGTGAVTVVGDADEKEEGEGNGEVVA